uniref:Maturase K n=1 Tax=Parascaris univalens TaxID=6257 RepID=A0A915A6T4_PARUN
MAFIFRDTSAAERSGERTDTSLGPRYDSMVGSIKDAFTSRFRRQRPIAAEDTMPDHSLAGDGQEPVLETGIARTETEEGTPDVHTALLRTEGTSAADDEEARAEEEERKRRMRLLCLRTEEEEENVDVDLYHFRRQWTHRPRFAIVLFKLLLASSCILLNVLHLLHAFSVLSPTFTIFSLQRASYQEAVDISRANLKQMLRDRVGIVARWSPYATATEDAQYDRCFVLVNNNLWSAWALYGSKENRNCGAHLYTRYRMLRIFLSPEISKRSNIRCPPTVQYRWEWRKACCPAGNPSLQSLINLAEGGLSDMICTQRDPAMVNASDLAHTCTRGTKPWCPLPTAIEVRNGYVYAKPTMVKSYELFHKTVLHKYWINVRRVSHRWFVDGEVIEFDTLSDKCGQHCYNMTFLLSEESQIKLYNTEAKYVVCVQNGQWELIDEDSSEECLAICAVKGK